MKAAIRSNALARIFLVAGFAGALFAGPASAQKPGGSITVGLELDISGYLVTITAMNAGVGVATAIAMQASGVGDPLLWGSVAFLLNYVPILGPLTAVAIFFAWVVTRTDTPWRGAIEFTLWLGFFFPQLPIVLGWVLLLDPQYGVLNTWLMSTFGLAEAGVVGPEPLVGAHVCHRAGLCVRVDVLDDRAGCTRPGHAIGDLVARAEIGWRLR